MTRARVGWRWMAAAAMAVAAGSAFADVKAGVEAWNKGDYPRAVAEWRGPALAGDPDAEYNMGQAYKLGRGVPADLSQAEDWYQKAAAQGHTLAQDNFGLALFQDGRKTDALPWLEKSVARDEKRTELVLGTMLFNGDGVAKDWVRAYALVNRSSQQGLPQASQTLAQMDGYLSPDQRQQGIALAGRIADQGRSAQMAALAGEPVNPQRSRTANAHATRPPLTGEPADAAGPTRPMPALASRPAVQTTDVPRSMAPLHGQPMIDARLDDSGQMGRSSMRPVPMAPPPARRPVPATHPVPAVAAGGHWRVQLGAFRDEGNARSLWTKVGSRVGGRPIYAKAGAVTRLQAGPFASKADAERACRAAGSGCVVVP